MRRRNVRRLRVPPAELRAAARFGRPRGRPGEKDHFLVARKADLRRLPPPPCLEKGRTAPLMTAVDTFTERSFRRDRPMSWLLAGAAGAVLLAFPAAAEDWPRFRGPTGQGISGAKNLPLRWSPSENAAWKTPIPGEGWSSPIVSGGRVFLTTATEGGKSCHVLCLDASDGRILWNVHVFDQETTRKEARNSYATPTPATDGHRIYAVFASGGIVALDREGRICWINRENRYYSRHGLAVSPILWRNLLILPFDGSQEASGEEERVGWQKPWDRSFLLGLDTETGKERWRARRGMSRIGHVTPIVLEVDGKDQLISPAGDVIQGFDPATGERIWTVRSQGEGVVPSPAAGLGLLFTTSGFEAPTLRAVRLGGAKGDATATHLAWEQRQNVPSVPSLLFADPHLFALRDNGFLSCRDARSGTILWQQRVGRNFSASPVLAEGRIYALADSGETVIVEAGGEYREVARNKIADGEGPVQASPAVWRGRLFLRTARQLWAIGP